jgi:hypothetical protein
MNFAKGQRSRGTITGYLGPAVFMTCWVVATAMFANQAAGSPRSLRTDIEDVLSSSMPVVTVSASSKPGPMHCTQQTRLVEFDQGV